MTKKYIYRWGWSLMLTHSEAHFQSCTQPILGIPARQGTSTNCVNAIFTCQFVFFLVCLFLFLFRPPTNLSVWRRLFAARLPASLV